MSGALQRVAGFFFVPAAAQRTEPAALPAATRAIVLGTSSDAVPLAAAHALALRAAVRASAALVAVWRPGDDDREARRGAATRAAARLAARLSAHGLPSVARGRLAWLVLPVEPAAAAAAVRRASAMVEGPLVTALSGPRPAELDGLVAEHDLAVVAADPDSPLARAALACLADLEGAARAPLGRGMSRALALAGLTAPHTTRLELRGATPASGGGGLGADAAAESWRAGFEPDGAAAASRRGGLDAGGPGKEGS